MTATHPNPEGATLARGRKALARGAWEEALESLRSAADRDPSDPAAWESLGTAHTWLQEADPAIDARQRAYALYRERGDDRSAARVALELANDFFEVRGGPAVANGWFQRARRLLDPLSPSGEHALLKIWDAYMALVEAADPLAAEGHAGEGVAIAEQVGARDVGILALALRGLATVGQGRVREGLDLLDEAAAGAIGGEVTDPQWFYFTCCCMIDACDQVRDYGRSLEWCHRLREFCARWRVEAFLTTCRLKYTGALLWRGEWEACESELDRAAAELRQNRPSAVDGALVRLAELRRRQGRRREAEDLLGEVKAHPLAVPVRAAVALDAGDPAAALGLLEGLLGRMPESARTERVAALELKARAHLALDRVEEARATARELEAIAAEVDTPALRAGSLAARGLVAAAASEHGEAHRLLEEALHLYQLGRSPWEAGRVRIEAARSLAALDRLPEAVREARMARDVLQALGAAAEAKRARELLEELEATETAAGEARNKGGRGPLTRRQREVLGLVAEGLADREIAARLYLSEHTVHRHVANILNRLEVGSRTAAVARAVREELI